MAEAIEITKDNFIEVVLESSIPVLITFWVPWFARAVEDKNYTDQLVDDYIGLMRITKASFDDCQCVADNSGVSGAPHFVIYESGVKQTEYAGYYTFEELQTFIDNYLNP